MLSRRSIFSLKKLASKAITARAFSLQQVPQSPQQTSVLNDPDIQKWKQLHEEIEKEQMKAIQEKLTQGQLKNIHEMAEEVVDLNLFEMKGLCHYLEIRNKNDTQIAKNMNLFQNILGQSDVKKEQVEKDVTKMAQTPQIPMDLVNKLLNPEIQDKLARALEIVSRGEAGLPAEAAKEAAPAKEEKKEEKKEKTAFNITLKAFKAENKIKVIKEVKAITGLGLKESKDKVEEVEKNPINLGQNVPKDKAAKIKQTLEELGCTVELT